MSIEKALLILMRKNLNTSTRLATVLWSKIQYGWTDTRVLAIHLDLFPSYSVCGLKRSAEMSQHSEYHTWDMESGWSTISAHRDLSFTLWFTGLPGTGKSTLALLVKKALLARGYKVEIIDAQVLTHWLNLKLQINEDIRQDNSHTPGYDAFITYICTILARNGIISITTSVSPYTEARSYAREQIHRFNEVYLYCPTALRRRRKAQSESIFPIEAEALYEPPNAAELSLNTGEELPERSALRLIAYLELHGYIAPLCEEVITDEEIEGIKSRLQALGYLD
jgi:adenylylsulfate kinase-like enzyme